MYLLDQALIYPSTFARIGHGQASACGVAVLCFRNLKWFSHRVRMHRYGDVFYRVFGARDWDGGRMVCMSL